MVRLSSPKKKREKKKKKADQGRSVQSLTTLHQQKVSARQCHITVVSVAMIIYQEHFLKMILD